MAAAGSNTSLVALPTPRRTVVPFTQVREVAPQWGYSILWQFFICHKIRVPCQRNWLWAGWGPTPFLLHFLPAMTPCHITSVFPYLSPCQYTSPPSTLTSPLPRGLGDCWVVECGLIAGAGPVQAELTSALGPQCRMTHLQLPTVSKLAHKAQDWAVSK